ncbi:MAG TPA: protein kinase [Longimicrobiales bacterium]|nr:protein kinase [Longimicrobiales bacterium]
MKHRSDPAAPPAPLVHDTRPMLSAAERWTHIKSVFVNAPERSESERIAFVGRACGDDAGLRNEVMSLLASERAAGEFAETPAAAVLAEPGEAREHDLERGTRLGVYEITGFLSAGGMGVVYRARHTVLDRQVAIKTLRAEGTDPLAKRRLLREARHAAYLTHPNICTIHEVGDEAGTPYIVMELVDGRPLNEIVRERVPPLDEALDCGIGIAAALGHAHEHGIVHRDLKSSNVVVDRDGRPVVLDFGLAKRAVTSGTGAQAESTMTMSGALAGTLSHMAPEVLLGDAADVRSDLWSFGCLLYEVMTGTLPFQGRTPFETSSAILNEPPRPPGPGVPLAVRLVIERCLMKDPNARYQHAREVRDALDAIRRRRAWPLVGRLLISARRRPLYAMLGAAALAGALPIGTDAVRDRYGSVGPIATMALLPIENATGDPDADYYAEGLTDALSSQLGSHTDVRIVSGTSALGTARTTQSLGIVAQQLGADVLMQGRLREASGRIAVDMRLIEPDRGRVLWSDTYERSSGQALALQADLVRAITSSMRLTVRPGADDRLATVRAVTPEAYEQYLKGRFEWNRRTTESLERAVEHFARSIELDPTYAPAHAALADCFNQFGTLMVGMGSPREFRPRARAAAIAALQIDPYSAEAHAALGYVRHYDWEWARSEQAFLRAIELNPSYANARLWYANLLMSRGRLDEAIEQVYAARALDPYSLIINTNVGWVLTHAGRAEEAIAQLEQTLELDSAYVHAHWRLADALRAAGRHEESYAAARRMVQLSGRDAPALGALASASATLGRMEEARAILAELLDRAQHQYVPPATIASVYLRLRDVDSALPWLTQAFEERANFVAYMAIDTAAGPLQRDPRFRELVGRSGRAR